MRKRIINESLENKTVSYQWLNVEHLAEVEVSSENPSYPIEAALIPGAGAGWRAGQPGRQAIRLKFDEPQSLRHIRLLFEDDERERTQEFVLRWSQDRGRTFRDVIRQQYNFSSPESTRECEDYDVDLDGVTMLELTIIPDISGAAVCASLAQFRLV